MRALQYEFGKRVRTWLESDNYSPHELIVEGETDTRLVPDEWAKQVTYRVKRDQETDKWGGGVRDAAPAPAVWIAGDRAFRMTSSVQFFCADLLALSKYGTLFGDLSGAERDYIVRAFSGLFASNRAFSNKTGFPARNDPTPRANYIKKQDMDKELPRFDKIRVCSDDHITGVVDGADLLIDHFSSVPSGYHISILEDPRVVRATIIRTDGSIGEFPQLNGAPVYIPLMSNFELRIPLKYLEKL